MRSGTRTCSSTAPRRRARRARTRSRAHATWRTAREDATRRRQRRTRATRARRSPTGRPSGLRGRDVLERLSELLDLAELAVANRLLEGGEVLRQQAQAVDEPAVGSVGVRGRLDGGEVVGRRFRDSTPPCTASARRPKSASTSAVVPMPSASIVPTSATTPSNESASALPTSATWASYSAADSSPPPPSPPPHPPASASAARPTGTSAEIRHGASLGTVADGLERCERQDLAGHVLHRTARVDPHGRDPAEPLSLIGGVAPGAQGDRRRGLAGRERGDLAPDRDVLAVDDSGRASARVTSASTPRSNIARSSPRSAARARRGGRRGRRAGSGGASRPPRAGRVRAERAAGLGELQRANDAPSVVG